MNPSFRPGKNIAMKVLTHEYEKTVAFYKDILGLEIKEDSSPDSFESVGDYQEENVWRNMPHS
jgi:catechol-2,3-dioxygenase